MPVAPTAQMAGTWICLWLLLASASVFANGDLGPVFRSLGVVDGLPDSRVESMVQDRYGYIWVGTQSGLVRLSGSELTLLSHDPASVDGLPGSNVMSLLAGSDGSVWAAIGGEGVVRIGPKLRPLGHWRSEDSGGELAGDNVWSMTEDCAGGIWLAFMRGGVARLDPATGELRHFDQHEDHGLAETGFQMSVGVDADCRIWLVQSEQVSVLADPQADRFVPVLRRNRDNGEPIFNALTQTRDGTILVAQLARLHRLGSDLRSELVFDAGATITGFAELEDGWLLMSSYNGLLRWHPAHGLRERVLAVDGIEDSLPASSLLDLMLDAEGGLWLAVARQGLAYLPPDHTAFSRYQPVPGRDDGLGLRSVAAVVAAEEADKLWLGSRDGGVQLLDLGSGQVQWLHEFFDNSDLAEIGPVTGLARSDQRLIMAWSSHVRMYDPAAAELRSLLAREEVDRGTFRFIRADGAEHVWIASFDAGLFRVRLSDGVREHFHPAGVGRHHWPELRVNALAEGPGGWWLAGRQTVYRQGPGGGFEAAISLDQAPILAMAWIGEQLWIATDLGLSHWTLSNGDPVLEAEHRSLTGGAGGRVNAIFPGMAGELWLVLSNGLARFDPVTGRLRRFSRDDGLAAAEFPEHAAARLADGRIAIGSARGLVMVHPDRAVAVAEAPPVLISGIQVGEDYISLAPNQRERVVLDHRVTALAVDYTALTFVAPTRTRFRLRLVGWDEDWLELLGQTRHYYSNLRPGRYRFEVQAASVEGQWGEAVDQLELLIETPPWRTGPALLAYGLFLLAVTGAGWRGLLGLRQRRREMREARQKRDLAEEQRKVIERLNANLEPEALAEVIGSELLQVCRAGRGWFLYQHERLPKHAIPLGRASERLSRDAWKARAAAADDRQLAVVELRVGEQRVASCLLEADSPGFDADHAERLGLLLEMAAQALQNLLLIERVRALAERAEQASAAKSEFLATMSHEIRTPLHGVMGMVELLDDDQATPGQQALLRTLRQSGRQLQRIIDDVLDISRIEAGRLNLEAQAFELVSLLEQVVDLHAPNAARKFLDLRLRMAADLPVLAFGDADRIAQVLGNLLSNAVKFTESGGIELSAECEGQWLCLGISDSGPGIAAADRARLFEPFVQLDASITRAHSGSGLGLAICRRLVAAMDGSLRLAEQGQRGSRFELRLPVLKGPLPVRPLSGLLQGQSLAAWLDAPTLRVLRRLGRRWGFAVIDARSRPAAAIDVLLVGERAPLDDPGLQQWLAASGHIVRLDVPYRKVADWQYTDRPVHLLRWPLLESRLVGLAMDRALANAPLGNL